MFFHSWASQISPIQEVFGVELYLLQLMKILVYLVPKKEKLKAILVLQTLIKVRKKRLLISSSLKSLIVFALLACY